MQWPAVRNYGSSMSSRINSQGTSWASQQQHVYLLVPPLETNIDHYYHLDQCAQPEHAMFIRLGIC